MWQIDENLAQRPQTSIITSESHPTGGGSRNVRILLRNSTVHEDVKFSDFFSRQKHTFDTFTGRNKEAELEWYAIEFPEPTTINCVDMMMGLPNRDGGWWASLNIEVRLESNEDWQIVQNLNIFPPYDFRNIRGNRVPYERYVLTFDEITVLAVRLIGIPGGLAQFTSLAQLGVYRRNLSRWNPVDLPERPVPYLFQLINPQTIWDISENFVTLTGLPLESPFVEYYLDESRFARLWERIRSTYLGSPDLWQMLGDSLGWDVWLKLLDSTATRSHDNSLEPHVSTAFYGILARSVAPVVVDGIILGNLTTRWVIPADYDLNLNSQRKYAKQHGIVWTNYRDAIKVTPRMSLEQLQAAATLLGMMLNTAANLMHHNLRYQDELASKASKTVYAQKKEIVRRAIVFMQDNLENSINVSEVAQAVALSSAYFCTLFTEETGRNPRDFLIDLRIARAKEYLLHSRMSISDVCAAIGYTPSYFSRLFKQQTGFPPRVYVKQFRSRQH